MADHQLALAVRAEQEQPVDVRRRRRVLDELAGIVDQADVKPARTQIQSKRAR